jgi:diguanylate cyclase (GGDEF)-like protein
MGVVAPESRFIHIEMTVAQHDSPVTRVHEQAVALLVATLGIAIGAGILPWGAHHPGGLPSLGPSLTTAAIIGMIAIAAILRNQYCATHFPPYAFLGTAYACTAALMLPYDIVLQAPHNALTTWQVEHVADWLWTGYHFIFIALVGCYVWSQTVFAHKVLSVEVERDIVRGFVAVAALATALVGFALLGGAYELPPFAIANILKLTGFHMVVERLLFVLFAGVTLGLIVLTRLRQSTQLWLAVVLILFVSEVFLDGAASQAPAFSVVWYAGLIEGFSWQVLLLFVLLRRASEQLEDFAEKNRTLTEETQRDPLTGLRNRRGFDDRLHAALGEARRSGGQVALLTLDLDHFKAYNDHFGHLAGDEALRSVARAISTVITRSRDVACRVGGEEFAVVLPFTDDAGAMTIAERIRAAVLHLRVAHAPNAPFPTLTVSVGVAVGSGAQSSLTLYESADRALYRAKRMGRNRIARFSAALHASDAALRAG